MNEKIYKKYLSTHPSYSHNQFNTLASNRYFTDNFQRFIPKDKKAVILDIGCGTGHFLKFVKEKGYMNHIGIDISKEQVAFCKKHVTKNVFYIKNLDAYLKKNKRAFDFVLLNDVIEHLKKDDIIHTLELLLGSLKKNGRTLIKTANLKNRWGMAVRYMDFTHTVGFTEETLSQVLLTAGFSEIEIYKERHPIHDVKSLIRISLKSLFELVYRLEYIASFGTFNPNLSNMLIAVARAGTKSPGV